MKLPVERNAEIEERLHVALRGLTCEFTTDFGPEVSVRGELVATQGHLDQGFRIGVAVYNAEGEVVGASELFVGDNQYLDNESFCIDVTCSKSHGNPARARVVVSPG